MHTSLRRTPRRRRLASPPPLWGRDRVGGRAELSFEGWKKSQTFEIRRDPPPQSSPTRGEEVARQPQNRGSGRRRRCVHTVASLLDKVARSAGWGMASCSDAG